ncbi:hypothetical protein [Peptostreptococcus stomatis]|uniref:hypothetical protein n=1 Tax=Peptostreptococcus stomatis TaxID=341694 RepID=UPI0028044567|nr:hypothetical protein [Peptostreptococcus stomatis]
MATKSFLKNINIKKKKDAVSFIEALEASKKREKTNTVERKVLTKNLVEKEEIVAFFNG